MGDSNKSLKNFFYIRGEHIDRETRNNKEKENNRNRLKKLDEKYASVISVIDKELSKRNINYFELDAKEFDEKVNEIIEIILSSPIYRNRFNSENTQDIRNALKRRLNANKNNQKEKEGIEL